MKKTLAIIITISIMIFGAATVQVQANSGDDLPDYHLPWNIDQG